LLFTERRWDKHQRIVYKNRLDRALRDLIRFPNRGQARDDILRGRSVEAHVI
jgi:plasmid stabilization system protein ParE